MSTNARQPGFPWVSTHFTVKDVDKAAQFYKDAFGFTVKEIVNGKEGSGEHAEITYQGQLIMLGKEGAWGSTTKTPITSGVESPMNLYVYCDDVDKFYQHALKTGAKSILKPDDMFWGDRMCTVQDLDGYNWCFATLVGEQK